MKIIILFVIFSCVFAQFNAPSLHKPSPFTNNPPNYNPSFVSNKYIPPQNIGGGMMSQGGFVQTINKYTPPQNIGGRMMSQGGFVEKNISPPSPVIQSIIDIATMTARGKKNE